MFGLTPVKAINIEPNHREKPLLSVRIKLRTDIYVNSHVYKDDTAQTVADRVFRHAHLVPTKENKDKRHLLAGEI